MRAVPSGEIGHLGGLDGLRGLALTAVLVFHMWPERLPGGILGMPLFFALSGYLITRMLLAQHDAGTLSLKRFWGRRVRRLAPASLLTVTVVTVVWSLAGWWDTALRGDVLAGVAQVANWRQVATGDQYGVDEAASPLLHLWSLALEEQVYLLIPLLVLAAGGTRRAVWAFAALVGVGVVSTALHAGDATMMYYGTHVRAGEVASGALAAAMVHRFGAGRSMVGRASRRAQTWAGVLSVTFALGLLWAMRETSLSTAAYQRGGLLLAAIASSVVVAGAAACPPLARWLDVAPLAYLGQRSYGIYLFHWPLLVGLRRIWPGHAAPPWVVLVVSVLLAEMSLRWWETPIRQQRWRIAPVRLGLPAAAVLVVTALVLPTSAATTLDMAAAGRQLEVLAPPASRPVTPAPAPGVTPSSTPPPPANGSTPADAPPAEAAPVRWGIVGDSKALALALGLTTSQDPRVGLGAHLTGLGCPLGRGGRVRDGVGSLPYDAEPYCDWEANLAERVAVWGPVDVMLVYFGSWDVRQRQVDALGEGWTTFPDAAYEAWLAEEAEALERLILDGAATSVQWLTVWPDPGYGNEDRYAAYNEFVRRRAPDPSGCVGTIDLAGWLAVDDRGRWAMPDGAHTTWDPDGGTSRLVGEGFLIEAIRDAFTGSVTAGCGGAAPDRPPSPPPPGRG